MLDRRGDVTQENLLRVKEAGYSDGEVAEILALVALNVLTNYFNVAFETPIDFPAVPPLTGVTSITGVLHARHAAPDPRGVRLMFRSPKSSFVARAAAGLLALA